MVQEQIVSSEKTKKENNVYRDELSRQLKHCEWKEYLLKDIATINPKTGKLPKEFCYIDLESVQSGMLKNKKIIKNNEAPSRAQRVLQSNDILYQTVRPYQKNNLFFNFDDMEYVASTGYAQIRTNELCNPEFLYYLLHTEKFVNNVLVRCTGTSYPAINSNDLKKIKVKIPNLTIQNKIEKILISIDKKIGLLEKKHSEYNQFFDFILNKIFKQELVFDNKTRWKEVTLNDLGTFYRGHSYNSSNVVEQGLVVLRSNNIQNNRLIFDDSQLQHVNKDCKNEIKLRKGDIVICMSNGTKSLVGKSAIYEGNYENNLTVGAFCSIFRSANPLSKYLLRTTQYKKNLHIILAGTNINNLKNEDIKKFKFKIPKDNEDIEKIGVFLGQLELKQNILNQELFNIKNFKKALLQKMFI